MGGYNMMDIKAGRLEGTLDPTIDHMTGGVVLRLYAAPPDRPSVTIQARTMEFDWPVGSSSFKSIIMTGNVRIDHPEADVRAERADWDFEKGLLIFTGNPVMNSDMFEGMRGERMVLNFEANTFDVDEMEAKGIPMKGSANPALLTADDLRDWPGWIRLIKEQADSEAPSPGRQLDYLTRGKLKAATEEQLLATPDSMIKQLNELLQLGAFYSEEAWRNIALPDEAAQLLQQESLDVPSRTRLNRLLLVAAYPNHVKALEP